MRRNRYQTDLWYEVNEAASIEELPPGNWRILGFAQSLKEEDWERAIEEVGSWGKTYNKNYLSPRSFAEGFTKTQSGHSLLKSEGLYVENPHNTDPNLLNMYPEWKSAQLLTNPLILIIE